jgi:hypothetical protein
MYGKVFGSEVFGVRASRYLTWLRTPALTLARAGAGSLRLANGQHNWQPNQVVSRYERYDFRRFDPGGPSDCSTIDAA